MLKHELDGVFENVNRKKDKKKRHSRGFSEDIQDKRAQRVSFKKYIREIEESELDYDQDYDDQLDY